MWVRLKIKKLLKIQKKGALLPGELIFEMNSNFFVEPMLGVEEKDAGS